MILCVPILKHFRVILCACIFAYVGLLLRNESVAFFCALELNVCHKKHKLPDRIRVVE